MTAAGPWNLETAEDCGPACGASRALTVFTSKSSLEVAELPGGKKRFKETKYINRKAMTSRAIRHFKCDTVTKRCNKKSY